MEVNGKVSILPKEKYKNVTLEDLNLKPKKVGLVANIIIDGNIMKNNLNNFGKTEEWLLKELKSKNKDLSNILLGTLDINDKVCLYEKNEINSKDILE